MIAIGVDPGVHTGFAVWHSQEKRFLQVRELKIHRALAEVEILATAFPELVVIFEDARKRQWFGGADARQAKYGAAIREGVGSVKRDCTIWEEYLEDRALPYSARLPMNTKWPAERFRMTTGWSERTNEHARDAGMLVYGMPFSLVQSLRITWERERSRTPRAKAATST